MISARIDGELEADDEPRLDEHIETCASCTAYEHDAYAFGRALQLHAVEPDNDDAPVVDLVGSMRGLSLMRITLFVIGGTLVILNASSVVSPDSGPAAHLGRHDGIFGTALGVGMLVVAARPHRAIGLVPLTSAIAFLMTAAAAADLLDGKANLLAEAPHLFEWGGLICLWVISGGPNRIPHHMAVVGAWLPRGPAARPQLTPLRSHPDSR